MNNLTYEETMLYIMYNDNVRYIQQLIDNNNVIRDNIISGSYFLRNNTTNNRRRNRNRNRRTNDLNNNNNNTHNSNYNTYNSNYNTPNSNYNTPNSNYNTPNSNYNTPNYNYYTPNYYLPNYYLPHYYLPPTYYRPNYNLSNSNYNANRTLRFQPSNMLYQRTYRPPLYTLQRQIELSTQNARYGDLVSPLHTICPISHEPFNENSQVTIIRHCGHIFNTTELNTWFTNNSVCPVCRYDVRNYRTHYLPQEEPQQEEPQPEPLPPPLPTLLDPSNNLLRRPRRNYISLIDISFNNLSDVDGITNDILNVFSSILLSDASYNSYFI